MRAAGLSECNADTIRRAHSVTPVSVLEMEYSLFSRDIEKDIIPLAKELGCAILAYRYAACCAELYECAFVSLCDYMRVCVRYVCVCVSQRCVCVRVRQLCYTRTQLRCMSYILIGICSVCMYMRCAILSIQVRSKPLRVASHRRCASVHVVLSLICRREAVWRDAALP